MRSEKYRSEAAYCVSFYVPRFCNPAKNPLIAIVFTGTVRTNRLTFLVQRISCLNIAKNISFLVFKTCPKIIQLAVMLYVTHPLSLRNAEDLLHERGVDLSHESVRYWWHRFIFKKALDKLANVYQSRTSSGMQWHGIQPVMQF